MPRRVSLPGASELFRPTQPVEPGTGAPVPDTRATDTQAADARADDGLPQDPRPGDAGGTQAEARRGSGRVRHDEKITVYVSSDELLALEQARLTLRAEHGMAVDRGRIVREAISALLADLQASGESSELVRRLSQP